MGSEDRQKAFQQLIVLSEQRGYVLFDDIMSCADSWSLPIQDVDWLSNSIITHGVLVYDEAPVASKVTTSDEEDYDDFAQRDYDAVFDRIIELDPGLRDFITTIRNIRPPQAREMDQLKYQVQEGNQFARQRVIEMHLRIAARIALQRSETYDTEIADTMQDACVGLMLAVDKYDPDTSGPFGSYASLWILQNISRMQSTQRPLVYYPVHKKDGYFSMYPLIKERGCSSCDKVWKCEKIRTFIAEKLNVNEDQVEDILCECLPIESYDEVFEMFLENMDVEEKHPNVFENTFKDEVMYSENLFEAIYSDAAKVALDEIISSCLKPREQQIIRARYGLDGTGEEKTLEEVGRTFGVTRERIRQIESKAISKLQNPSQMRKLKDLL